ncbi:hypothetical protein BN1723_019271 [Verticillium longisporum]|uniref:Uncharacterized protein n=1 Tax=Verticillium longisporum TaxID=100787 RepID=A0A0G4NBH6_VERLO|nr:hypothetical protein BN1723_019271 [Verticillium longisporum]
MRPGVRAGARTGMPTARARRRLGLQSGMCCVGTLAPCSTARSARGGLSCWTRAPLTPCASLASRMLRRGGASARATARGCSRSSRRAACFS